MGRHDIVNMIPVRPRIEGTLVIFEMEKGGFARTFIETRDDVKNDIAEAMGKTDGKTYKVRIVEPRVTKSVAEEDPLNSFEQFDDIEIR